MKTYIHYGHDHFDPNKVTKSISGIGSKPDRGLWASPVDANYSWKEWCEAEDFRVCEESNSFKFTLTSDAKILDVRCENDILDYVITNDDFIPYANYKTGICDSLDLGKLYSDYDGMELHMSENFGGLRMTIFNTWDCDSIVVWNPKVIVTES